MTARAPRPAGCLRSLALLAALVYLGLLALSSLLSDRLAFSPPPRRLDSIDGLARFTSDDGTPLTALHLRREGGAFTIAFFHGSAEDIQDLQPFLRALVGRGFAVAALDYRGYGESRGAPTELTAYQDADRFYRYLVEEAGVRPERLILHGRSLGSCIAAHLASRRAVGGLILESSFVSGTRLVTRWRLFPSERFPTQGWLRSSSCPVLLLHGACDATAPAWHAEALERTRGGTELRTFDGAGHGDLADRGGKDYLDAINAFARKLLSTGHGLRPS